MTFRSNEEHWATIGDVFLNDTLLPFILQIVHVQLFISENGKIKLKIHTFAVIRHF